MSNDREKFLVACQSENEAAAKESWAKIDEKEQEYVLIQDKALDITTIHLSKAAMILILNTVSRNSHTFIYY